MMQSSSWTRKLWRSRQGAGSTRQNTGSITTIPSIVDTEHAGIPTVVPSMAECAKVPLVAQTLPPIVAATGNSMRSSLLEQSSEVRASSEGCIRADSTGPTDASSATTSHTLVGPENTKCSVPTCYTSTFNTLDLHPEDQPQSENSKTFSMQANLANLAGIPIGLNWLNIERSSNISIKAFSRPTISPDSVEVHLDSPADTVLYSAGCTWLNVAAQESNFQYGKFSTVDDNSPLRKRQKQSSRKITFPKPFPGKPQVIVWLNEFHMSNSDNWRCKAYATEITAQSFVIHIDTWASTKLYSATASWIAYDSNLPNISSGSFNTMDVRPWYIPRKKNKGAVRFHKTFESAPCVFAALNWLDISNKTNLRMKLEMSEVSLSAKGLTWHLDTWDCTVLYSAGASYIAVVEV